MSEHRVFLEWASYLRDVIPNNVSDVQKEECKRSFYAGAVAILEVVGEISEEEVPEETATSVMEGLYEECEEFVKEIRTLKREKGE